MSERALFDGLPEQRAPGDGELSAGAPRMQEVRRDQILLRAVDLDGLIAADDPVRSVWAFVLTLNLKPLEEQIKAREGTPGRPAIPPQLLVALWLHATLRGVGAARALARLCETEVTFQWLCGEIGVNYHTLADFRVAHEELLDRLLTESVAALVEAGLVSLDRTALDGLRIRAAAGAGSFHRKGRIGALLAEAGALVGQLRREVDDEPAAGERRRKAAERRAAAERLARVEAARRRLEALEAERARRGRTNKAQSEKQKEPRASTTDPEARVMKMADGGFRPAYNAEIASDAETQVVLAVALDTSGSDRGWIGPMLDRLRERFGRVPKELLADGAFGDNEDIEAAAAAGITVYLRPTRNKHRTDPLAPREEDGPGVAAWRARMASEVGQQVYRRRGLCERVHAMMRHHGLTRVTVRGAAKARTVVLWHALAHNLQCWARLHAPAKPA
jgi:transposase